MATPGKLQEARRNFLGALSRNGDYNEINNSMNNIHHNFHLSFLAVNFINQRPFNQDIILELESPRIVIKASSINNLSRNMLQEYGNFLRRLFLNDMVLAYERYATLM